MGNNGNIMEIVGISMGISWNIMNNGKIMEYIYI